MKKWMSAIVNSYSTSRQAQLGCQGPYRVLIALSVFVCMELVGLGLITAMCLLIGDYENQKAGPVASG